MEEHEKILEVGDEAGDDDLIDAAHFNMGKKRLESEIEELGQQVKQVEQEEEEPESRRLRELHDSLGGKKREYAFLQGLSKEQIDHILLSKDNHIVNNFRSKNLFLDDLQTRRQQFYAGFEANIDSLVKEKMRQNKRVTDPKTMTKFLKSKEIYKKIGPEE